MALESDQITRYARHLMLKEIGGIGQRKLRQASVAIIGLGGLGGPAALYLAAAGIGKLRLVDADQVALSNLQRQIQFHTTDIDRPKTKCLSERIQQINPDTSVQCQTVDFNKDNGADLISGMDLVIDATDNFTARFAINAACHEIGQPLLFGAATGWQAQMGLLLTRQTRSSSAMVEPSPCYQCFVPECPPNTETCEDIGIIGALTGIVGSRMALETIKFITGMETQIKSHIWTYDALHSSERILRLRADPKCALCGTPD